MGIDLQNKPASARKVTYVLATGGHNVGIVSEPGKAGHSFRMLTKPAGRALPRSGSIPRRREATRLFVVAGLDRMDWRTFQRRNGVAAYGGRRRRATRSSAMCQAHMCLGDDLAGVLIRLRAAVEGGRGRDRPGMLRFWRLRTWGDLSQRTTLARYVHQRFSAHEQPQRADRVR